MRGEAEIVRRAERTRQRLLAAVERRAGFVQPDAEQDLAILSLLDQWETLVWVLEEAGPEPALH